MYGEVAEGGGRTRVKSRQRAFLHRSTQKFYRERCCLIPAVTAGFRMHCAPRRLIVVTLARCLSIKGQELQACRVSRTDVVGDAALASHRCRCCSA